jgi:hypothetical protein
MAYSHRDVIAAQAESLAVQRARALNDYEAARLSEDNDGTMAAADQIVEIDARAAALSRIANNLAAGSRAAPLAGEDEMSRGDALLARKYGITAQQLGIAKGWTADSRMSDEQKVTTYIENTNRYRQARASGQYRDDQGTVRR